jgi:UDP-N-acetylmuramoyl-tripeptide--D-alanyl-D-alanine ligase
MTAATMGATLSLDTVLAATGGRLAAGRARPGFAGVSIDSRSLKPGELFVAVAGPRFDGHEFVAAAAARGAAAALIEREVAAPEGFPLLRVPDTTRALADLARHVRLAAGLPVLCVTGSTGKTTTKEIGAALLSALGPVLKSEGNFNNQYGLPLSLLKLLPEHRSAALELGMSGAGELRRLSAIAQPDVAVITNVAAVHLEFFASVDEIAHAKAEILEGLRPGGTAVLNGDDVRVWRIGERHPGRVVWFGRERDWDVTARDERPSADGTRFLLQVAGESLEVSLPLSGAHNVMNFLAAAAAAHALGVPPARLAELGRGLAPAPHRGERLRLGEGVTLVDDCYNSNPAALEAAVAALQLVPGARRVAFLGDMLELGPAAAELHRQAGERLAGRLQLVVGVGKLASQLLAGALAAGLPAAALHHFEDAGAAAAAAGDLVRPGDAVLVKGSRGVRLEGVVEALGSRFGRVE